MVLLVDGELYSTVRRGLGIVYKEWCYLLMVKHTDCAKGNLAMFTNKNDLSQLCEQIGDNFPHLLLNSLDVPITLTFFLCKTLILLVDSDCYPGGYVTPIVYI